jgi:hypothetical protein
MRLSDDELALLIVHSSGSRREVLLNHLRFQIRAKLQRRRPSPTGKCSAGRRVRVDDKGAMSSGYVYHLDVHGCGVPGYCEHTPIEWDAPSAEQRRYDALMATL